jgi:ankyrin repeat protein
VEVVKTLLAAGAEVDKADNHGMTPLYWASCHGHVEVVKTLLAAEAEVDKADSTGLDSTALGLPEWARGGGEDPPGSRGGGGQSR